VSGHNPKISSQPKWVNLVFAQFQPGGMCPDTFPEFLAIQNV